MAGIHKIKAKQIDILSVENELNDTFLKKSEVDTELSEDSNNPIANNVIYKALDDKANSEDVANLQDQFNTLDETLNDVLDGKASNEDIVNLQNQVSTLDETLNSKASSEDITNLQDQISTLDENLNDKASVNNPTFTGTVILPPISSESGDDLKAATVGYVHEVMQTYSNIIDGGEI